MPLFMDFHKLENITVEDVQKAHMADEAIQEQYGVRYHQFWVNVEAGTVFCLTEGPDKATCEKVHQMAHGNIACAMTEVEPGHYKVLMGETEQVDHGAVKKADGSIDLGYRNIISINAQGLTDAKSPAELNLFQSNKWIQKIINDAISGAGGRVIEYPAEDHHIAVFRETAAAIECAERIQRNILKSTDNAHAIVRIGISAGQPVTEDGEFFTQAIRLANQLCALAPDNSILASSLVQKLSKNLQTDTVRMLSPADEEFAARLFDEAEKQLTDETFTIDDLGQSIAISRPQLYRRITSLTGRSPNDLIRDLRMTKALALLKAKKHNITQVAMEVGYTSPSYFAKCFAKKFGCTPSAFVMAAQ
jgi:AraC-like DNA-binding protein